MKKGFALAELLGVIAILGIISLITVPLVNGSIEKSNEKLYQTQLNQIVKGAKNYYEEHLSELPEEDTYVTVTLKELQDAGYLPLSIENPKTKEEFLGTTEIKCTNKNGKYEYEIDKTTLGEKNE